MTDTPSISSPSTEQDAPPRRSPLLAIVIAVCSVLLLAGVGVFFAYRMMIARADDGVTRFVASSLRVPAARVGTRSIPYSEFLIQRDAIKKFLASPAAQKQEIAIKVDSALEQNVLEKLMREAAFGELAEERKVAIDDTELRKYFADVVSAASSTTPDMGVYLLETFGWNEEDFRQRVLKPALLEEKLGALFASEKEGDPNALDAYLETRLAKGDVVKYVRF